MAQPAQLTPLEQAHLDVKNRIIELKAMAPNDYNHQQQLLAADVELQNLKALFEGLKLQGPAPPTPSPELVQFWRFMRGIQGNVNAGDTIDFGAAGIMARDDLSKLFVRSCYMDVWPAVETALNEKFKTLILGTPGIGKSHFGFFVLLLLVNRGETVVYQGRQERSRILFSPQGIQLSGFRDRGFDHHLDNLNVFYLVDAMTPDIVKAKTILFSSPRDDVWSMVPKEAKTAFFYLPPWSLEELKKCRQSVFNLVTEARVDELFNKWGGIARFVLEYADDLTTQDQLDQAIDTSSARSIKETLDALKQSRDVSHKVVHFIPKDNYRRYTTVFASEYVADKIYAQISERNLNDVRDFLNGSMGLGDFGASRGRVFERYVHYRFERGTFRTRNLRTGAVENLIIPASANPTIYDNVVQLQTVAPNDYARPRQTNARSIDSVIKPNWLFQITVADRHPCREDGLAETLDAMGLTAHALQEKRWLRQIFTDFFPDPYVLPRPRLYFVVPKDKFPTFVEQRYTDTNDHVLGGASSDATKNVWQLEQWVLEVKLTA